MKYSKAVLGIVFIMVFSLLFTSCVSNQTNQTDTSVAPTVGGTIEIMTSWGGVDSKAGILNEIIDKFEEENPSIQISNQSIFGDDYLPTLKTKFASGNEPDVFGLWPGSDIKYLMQANKVVDLSEKLNEDKAWKDSFNQASFRQTTYNKQIYGIPFELVFEGLFINKDLFEKYGVKEPTNYKELKEAILVFNRNDITPIAYNSFAEGSYIYQNMVASLGGSEGVIKYIQNNRINKNYIEAMYYMKELYDMQAFPKDALTISSNERNNLFITKKAAMIVQGSWFIPYFEKSDASVKMIPFPSMGETGSKLPTGLGNGTFYISKKGWSTTEGEEITVKFLKYLTSRETAAYFFEKTGLISNVNLEYKAGYSVLANQSLGVYKNTPEKNRTPIPDHVIDRSVWNDVIISQFPYFLEGSRTAEEIWDQAVERILSIK